MGLTVSRVEDALDLTVLDRQAECGVTELAKEFFETHRQMLNEVVEVVLVYVTDPSWDFITYVVDDANYALSLDGFAWGYFGEGVRGLLWLFEVLGWNVAPLDLPPAHEEGVWAVYPDGTVAPVELG